MGCGNLISEFQLENDPTSCSILCMDCRIMTNCQSTQSGPIHNRFCMCSKDLHFKLCPCKLSCIDNGSTICHCCSFQCCADNVAKSCQRHCHENHQALVAMAQEMKSQGFKPTPKLQFETKMTRCQKQNKDLLEHAKYVTSCICRKQTMQRCFQIEVGAWLREDLTNLSVLGGESHLTVSIMMLEQTDKSLSQIASKTTQLAPTKVVFFPGTKPEKPPTLEHGGHVQPIHSGATERQSTSSVRHCSDQSVGSTTSKFKMGMQLSVHTQ